MRDRPDIDIGDIMIIAEKTETEEFRFECREREYDGFVYFMEGEGELRILGTTLVMPVFAGMLFWFRKGDSYRFRVKPGCRYVTSAYRILRDTENVASFPFPTMSLPDGKEALAIERLVREWESHRPAGYMRCKLGILSLYTELMVDDRTPKHEPAVAAAVDFIHKNFRRPFTGAELAAACSLSPSYLRQRFREVLGISVTEYRNRLRMEAAREMLESGLFTPKETAYELGYSDVYHFSKAFSAKEGITPARYAGKKK